MNRLDTRPQTNSGHARSPEVVTETTYWRMSVLLAGEKFPNAGHLHGITYWRPLSSYIPFSHRRVLPSQLGFGIV